MTPDTPTAGLTDEQIQVWRDRIADPQPGGNPGMMPSIFVDQFLATIDRLHSEHQERERELRGAALSGGVGAIAKERERQIEKGWTPEHDNSENAGDLTLAAVEYAKVAAYQASGRRDVVHLAGEDWPWADAWNPSSDPIRNLEKAGALIAAEIDRFRRIELDHIAAALSTKENE